ncbi:unnamed protein product [Danaus chrysippus]|uniref:(African queen) hypothetical protein n=1 Tax=Danaus chrysippus TaxID=151541 RepID=A0A8J2VXC7_9NEOP|nr:unnamed protein product [Danaus chrysippus]
MYVLAVTVVVAVSLKVTVASWIHQRGTPFVEIRFFPNPVNYNDNELFCGGYAVGNRNGGKVRGMRVMLSNLSEPRPHEAGGMYGKGIITDTALQCGGRVKQKRDRTEGEERKRIEWYSHFSRLGEGSVVVEFCREPNKD